VVDVGQITLEGIDLEQNTRQTFKTVQARVKQLCDARPSCTGNYSILVHLYYQRYHRHQRFWEDKAFKHRPSPETITRAFRKLVELGELKPSGKILARRKAREIVVKEIMKEG
jgi:hypothetical protein